MKSMTKEFSGRDRFLLVILGVVILALLYYLWVDVPVRNGAKEAKSNIEALETQKTALEAQLVKINSWRTEAEQNERLGRPDSFMPSYNASKEELDFLNTTLADTRDYYIGFTQITREGDQIRRSFALDFSAVDYNAAVEVLSALENSHIRCLIGDLSVYTADDVDSLMSGPVTVNATATFYETMHDGVEDKELPADTAAE